MQPNPSRASLILLSVLLLLSGVFPGRAATNNVVTNTIVVTNLIAVTTTLVVSNGVSISTNTAIVTNAFDRAGLATNRPATNALAAAKKIPWDITVTAGLSLTKGNSDTMLGTLNTQGSRKWKQDEFDFGADVTYGENNGIMNNELVCGFVQYNWAFGEKTYGSLRVEGRHDGIADIRYRIIVSPALGYYFIKNTNGFFRAEIGPGVVCQQLGDTASQYLTFRVAEKGEWKLSPTTKIWESAEVLPQVDQPQNFIVNAEFGIEASITPHFGLRTYLLDNFNNEPAPGRMKNDIKLVAGVSYKL